MRMTRAADRHPEKPGEFAWVRRFKDERGWQVSSDAPGSIRCLAVILPGEHATAFLPVEPCPEWLNGGVHWEWNGNEDAPTLTPSVDSSKTGGWHGFIRAGVMKGV